MANQNSNDFDVVTGPSPKPSDKQPSQETTVEPLLRHPLFGDLEKKNNSQGEPWNPYNF